MKRLLLALVLLCTPLSTAWAQHVLNLRDAVHGGFKVIGPGQLILFTAHTVDKGKPLYDAAK